MKTGGSISYDRLLPCVLAAQLTVESSSFLDASEDALKQTGMAEGLMSILQTGKLRPKGGSSVPKAVLLMAGRVRTTA